MTLAARLRMLARAARDTGRLMVGIPSYDAYLAHFLHHHPDAVPLTEAEFFKDRQKARFGEKRNGGFRCC